MSTRNSSYDYVISIHVPREGDDSKTAQRKNTLFVKVVQFCVKTKGK